MTGTGIFGLENQSQPQYSRSVPNHVPGSKRQEGGGVDSQSSYRNLDPCRWRYLRSRGWGWGLTFSELWLGLA